MTHPPPLHFSPIIGRLLGAVGASQAEVAPTAAVMMEGGSGELYSASVLAARGRRRVVLCEAPVGLGHPSRADRLALNRALDEAGDGQTIVVFTDAAHSACIWSLREPTCLGAPRYVEYRTPPREGELVRWLRDVHAERARRGGGVVFRGRESPSKLLSQLVPLLRRRIPPGYAGASGILDWIRESESVGVVRSMWRLLTGFGVLDPECGEGEWLLTAGQLLEPIYGACLDRKRSWVDDASAQRRRRRPEYLRDFRAVLALAEDQRKYDRPVLFLRRLIVQRNLYGAEISGGAARACRRRLLDWAGLGRDGRTPIDANVRRIPAHPGLFRGYGSPTRALGGQLNGWPKGTAEEVQMLWATLRMLRDLRLGQEQPDRELKAAAAELERRRRKLRRTREGDIEGADHPPIGIGSFELEFLRPEGFDLVRSSESWDR